MVSYNPLTAQPPEEVPLEEAPLIRVIAQVRFPPILSVEQKAFVASFQEAIREQYPILQPEQTQGLVLSSQGLMPTTPQITWRFIDTEGNWRVSLAPDFMALETTAYTSRSDFLLRLQNLLSAFGEHIKPKTIERFGIRYINRLTNLAVEDVSKLLRPEITGIVTAEFGENIRQTINESLFDIPGGEDRMIARWGLMPAGATFDPDAIEPITQSSWILDLDMSLSKKRDFSVGLLIGEAQRFTERIYTFFRWAVTDDFLQYFGGKL
ncbi:TIGR04255 family protein [Chroococcidiopsis thermalis]|uniref:TIGR04255 family protein n=1 Tax=Chroococcidiopsis thermalis (strain PCC 7203) TaxID=251229 RepID=K9U7M8_CHRTP|nr:TIGR04255 family protein [Chroococcidiopsis thermalis]AFY91112.1 hypothetical protein Chro_5771 [Chroococcidiopsis thermalis PCC 7203]